MPTQGSNVYLNNIGLEQFTLREDRRGNRLQQEAARPIPVVLLLQAFKIIKLDKK